MITNPSDYEELLWLILSNAPTKKAILLPKNELIYEIDLNTRKITVPTYLSVKNDHQAETIYFKFDRYYDNIDLLTTSCFIKYTNAENNSFIYPVPYYDTETAIIEDKIIIPWCILGQATKKAGKIKFSVCFFKVNLEHKLSYALNTLVAESNILQGLNTETYIFNQEDITLDDSLLELIQELKLAKQEELLTVYWTDV